MTAAEVTAAAARRDVAAAAKMMSEIQDLLQGTHFEVKARDFLMDLTNSQVTTAAAAAQEEEPAAREAPASSAEKVKSSRKMSAKAPGVSPPGGAGAAENASTSASSAPFATPAKGRVSRSSPLGRVPMSMTPEMGAGRMPWSVGATPGVRRGGGRGKENSSEDASGARKLLTKSPGTNRESVEGLSESPGALFHFKTPSKTTPLSARADTLKEEKLPVAATAAAAGSPLRKVPSPQAVAFGKRQARPRQRERNLNSRAGSTPEDKHVPFRDPARIQSEGLTRAPAPSMPAVATGAPSLSSKFSMGLRGTPKERRRRHQHQAQGTEGKSSTAVQPPHPAAGGEEEVQREKTQSIDFLFGKAAPTVVPAAPSLAPAAPMQNSFLVAKALEFARLADSLHAEGRLLEAQEALQRGLSVAPDSWEHKASLYGARGKCLLGQGRYMAAAVDCRQGLKRDGTLVELGAVLGQALLTLGSFDEAEAVFAQAIHNIFTRGVMGVVEGQVKLTAERGIQAAYTARSSALTAVQTLQHGDVDRAAQAAEQVLGVAPFCDAALETKAACLAEARRWHDVVRFCEQCCMHAPADPEIVRPWPPARVSAVEAGLSMAAPVVALYCTGLRGCGRRVEARSVLQAVLHRTPAATWCQDDLARMRQADALSELSETQRAAGDLDAAVLTLGDLLALDPGEAGAERFRADVLMQRASALSALLRFRDVVRDCTEAIQLILLLDQEGRGMATAASKATGTNGGENAHLLRARANVRLARWAEALADFEEYVNAHPQDKGVAAERDGVARMRQELEQISSKRRGAAEKPGRSSRSRTSAAAAAVAATAAAAASAAAGGATAKGRPGRVSGLGKGHKVGAGATTGAQHEQKENNSRQESKKRSPVSRKAKAKEKEACTAPGGKTASPSRVPLTAEYSGHYDVLGLDSSATLPAIKKAYRKLALKYHPDRNKAKEAEEYFKKVNAAYCVLSSPGKKGQYDRTLTSCRGGGLSNLYAQNTAPQPQQRRQWREASGGGGSRSTAAGGGYPRYCW